MSVNKDAKQLVVTEIKEKFSDARATVLVDYRGLTVEEVTELRKQFRAAKVEYRVLKNSLIERAVNEMNLGELTPFLSGPTAVAFGYEDPIAPAKILTDFMKKTKKMQVKAGVVEGKVISMEGVRALAELPSKEVLVAKLLGSMNAPITGLVGVLSATLRSLVYTINAIKEQKEA